MVHLASVSTTADGSTTITCTCGGSFTSELASEAIGLFDSHDPNSLRACKMRHPSWKG
jgi:hypothetical protein